MNIIPQEGQEWIALAGFVCGLLLGLCGGLKLTQVMLVSFKRRLDALERITTPEEVQP
jgi:hypothetical protein